MTDTANHLVPEQGKLRRALAAVFAFLQAMEYTSFDYTLDRIERLEREVGRLRRNCAKAAIGPRRCSQRCNITFFMFHCYVGCRAASNAASSEGRDKRDYRGGG